MLRITFSTSCQHSPSRSIFNCLAHLCCPFIHAFSIKFSLFSRFPFSQNMRQSTVTPKISRNKNLSGWAYLVHLFLYLGSKNQFITKSFLFLKTWISKGKNRGLAKFQEFVIFGHQKNSKIRLSAKHVLHSFQSRIVKAVLKSGLYLTRYMLSNYFSMDLCRSDP